MPLPFLAGAVVAKIVLGATVAAGVTGATKGVKGVLDSNQANEIQEQAEDIISSAQHRIKEQKEQTSNDIQNLGKLKLNVYGNQLKMFIDEFSKIRNIDLSESTGINELGKIVVDERTIKEMKETSLNASHVLGSGAAGVGAGVLLGWGTYGSVMALGTASTGAAIGGLSGIAASNATLAWLGGGALAAGGGGMALGTLVLGGLIAGPALLLSGGIFASKAKEKLNNAYSNLSEARRIEMEINIGIKELNKISNTVNQNKNLLKRLASQFDCILEELQKIVSNNTDWRKFNQIDKNKVAISYKYAQIIKQIIDTPILSEEGNLTNESEQILKNEEILALYNK